MLLGLWDVGGQNQAWNLPTQSESGDKSGDQMQEVSRGPSATWTCDAQ